MNAPQLRELLQLTLAGIERGAEVLRTHFGNISLQQAEVKSARDYVSQVDLESETVLREFFQRGLPGSIFLGEEMGQGKAEGEYRWIVDPLDGTTNYLQHFPIFAVSAALERCQPGQAWGELLVGAVIHPLTGDIWTAMRGQGAWKNNHPIHASRKDDLALCLLGTGFPYRANDQSQIYLRTLAALSACCSGIRRPGAAALDLCWTAEGVFDGFWEHNLSPWDIAAGALIIQEAGGKVTSFGGSKNFLSSGNVVAANPHIHPRMLEIIQAEAGSALA